MKEAVQRSSLILLLAIAPVASLLVACGGGDDDVSTTTVNEQKPDPLVIQAFIEGTVIDGITRTPIQGATVSVPAAAGSKASFTTTETGFYRLALPDLGAHTVFVEANGYARAKYTVNAITEPGAAGNITVTAVRNSSLYPRSGSLRGRVSSGGTRDLVALARVLVQFTDVSDPIEDREIEYSTETDKHGEFSLSDLPAGTPQTRVTVFPVDLDGDEQPDTAIYSELVSGGATAGTLLPGSENFMDISVGPFVTDKLLWTNLDDDAAFPSDGQVVLTFAQPMLSSNEATVIALRIGTQKVGIDFEWQDTTTLVISPKEPLVGGQSYALTVQAQSVAGNAVSYTKTLEVQSTEAPSDTVTSVELADPQSLAWNTKTLSLTWDAIPGAESYRVFARNDSIQSAWLVLFEGRVSGFEKPRVTVSLPDSFDTFPSEDAFSATGFGTKVWFAVQAFNGRNDGPFPEPSAYARLSDEKCPRLRVLNGTTSANNTSDKAIRMKYLVSTIDGEPLSDAFAPKFSFSQGVESDSFTIDPKTMETRRIASDQFEVSFLVPADSNGASDVVSVDLSKGAVSDTSGNIPNGTTDCPTTLSFLSN